eukprot:COSAG01_NODE_42684_length_437_cov_1.849112_2_plen_21_part_01
MHSYMDKSLSQVLGISPPQRM